MNYSRLNFGDLFGAGMGPQPQYCALIRLRSGAVAKQIYAHRQGNPLGGAISGKSLGVQHFLRRPPYFKVIVAGGDHCISVTSLPEETEGLGHRRCHRRSDPITSQIGRQGVGSVASISGEKWSIIGYIAGHGHDCSFMPFSQTSYSLIKRD